jgi:hypothetical protein
LLLNGGADGAGQAAVRLTWVRPSGQPLGYAAPDLCAPRPRLPIQAAPAPITA